MNRELDNGTERTKFCREVNVAYNALEKIEVAEQLIDEKIAVLLDEKRSLQVERDNVYSVLRERG
jgi:predicted nucleic acid-binding protein